MLVVHPNSPEIYLLCPALQPDAIAWLMVMCACAAVGELGPHLWADKRTASRARAVRNLPEAQRGWLERLSAGCSLDRPIFVIEVQVWAVRWLSKGVHVHKCDLPPPSHRWRWFTVTWWKLVYIQTVGIVTQTFVTATIVRGLVGRLKAENDLSGLCHPANRI